MSSIDRARVEAFLDRFVDLASGATTIGLLAVADRTGLSRHLAETGGGTAEEIADAAGLETRYVTEILSGLAAAGVVEYEPDTERFSLPPEHALFVADETSPYFMGGFLDMIPAALSHIEAVAEATRHGGGVSFDAFGSRFVAGIDRGNSPSQRAFLVPRWLPAVPGLVERLDAGMRVADIGCGSGTAALLIAEAFPNSHVVGFDVSPESIALARDRSRGIPNIQFEQRPVQAIAVEPGFGLVTAFDVIHDLAHPDTGMAHIREMLTEEGVFLMMEPNLGARLEDNLHPRGALMYGVSALHCLTQSLAQGGMGLGAAWGPDRAREMAEGAGFSSFEPLEKISNRFSAFYLLRP